MYQRELVYLQVLQVLPVCMPSFLGVACGCDRCPWLSLELFATWAVKTNSLQDLDTKEQWFKKL